MITVYWDGQRLLTGPPDTPRFLMALQAYLFIPAGLDPHRLKRANT